MKTKASKRISEVARLAGIYPKTISRLERHGLLRAARDWPGHRRFGEENVERLRGLLRTNKR